MTDHTNLEHWCKIMMDKVFWGGFALGFFILVFWFFDFDFGFLVFV